MNIEKYTCRSCGFKEYVPCDQIIDIEGQPVYYCNAPSAFYYRWSDRRTTACNRHEDLVIKNYEGDHEYDQTGLHKYGPGQKHGPWEKIR